MRFVDLETARNAPGVRLVVLGAVASPWSEAARGLLVANGIDGMLVRFGVQEEAVKSWTGWHNAPVLFVDAEPPRMHWSDILETIERLGGHRLVPSNPDERARVFGLIHELLGENGLAWSARIVLIHRGFTTDGSEGFPIRLARYLAAKYGYAPDRVAAAKERAISLLQRFGELLNRSRKAGNKYLLGGELGALDVYLAATVGLLAPLPPERCKGMHEVVRHALATTDGEVRASVSAAMLEHRDLVYERHLGLPLEL
jgi:glutathione S-transferase